jgi:hypothetical protein
MMMRHGECTASEPGAVWAELDLERNLCGNSDGCTIQQKDTLSYSHRRGRT